MGAWRSVCGSDMTDNERTGQTAVPCVMWGVRGRDRGRGHTTLRAQRGELRGSVLAPLTSSRPRLSVNHEL